MCVYYIFCKTFVIGRKNYLSKKTKQIIIINDKYLNSYFIKTFLFQNSELLT